MKKPSSFLTSCCILLFSFFLAVACSPALHFNQQIFTQTASAKQQTLNVMDMATENFQAHQTDVQQLRATLQNIYDDEKKRPKNEPTIKMWEKMTDSTGRLLGGFLRRWETDGKLNKTYIDDKKNQFHIAGIR